MIVIDIDAVTGNPNKIRLLSNDWNAVLLSQNECHIPFLGIGIYCNWQTKRS